MQNIPISPGIECLRKQMFLHFSVCERCDHFVRFYHDNAGIISSVLCEWVKDKPVAKKPEPPVPPMLTGVIPDGGLDEDIKDGEVSEL